MMRPLYRVLSSTGGLARLLPASFGPRVVVFRENGKDRFRLLMGRRVIGRFEEKENLWRIRSPYRLMVDVRTLPGKPGQ